MFSSVNPNKRNSKVRNTRAYEISTASLYKQDNNVLNMLEYERKRYIKNRLKYYKAAFNDKPIDKNLALRINAAVSSDVNKSNTVKTFANDLEFVRKLKEMLEDDNDNIDFDKLEELIKSRYTENNYDITVQNLKIDSAKQSTQQASIPTASLSSNISSLQNEHKRNLMKMKKDTVIKEADALFKLSSSTTTDTSSDNIKSINRNHMKLLIGTFIDMPLEQRYKSDNIDITTKFKKLKSNSIDDEDAEDESVTLLNKLLEGEHLVDDERLRISDALYVDIFAASPELMICIMLYRLLATRMVNSSTSYAESLQKYSERKVAGKDEVYGLSTWSDKLIPEIDEPNKN
ncbi:hypothetical protein GJ496_007391 [Pomphorhynchus laevis]|nr:hypothetical protein GJ496_007391 [Pomphorhynchus laevis]